MRHLYAFLAARPHCFAVVGEGVVRGDAGMITMAELCSCSVSYVGVPEPELEPEPEPELEPEAEPEPETETGAMKMKERWWLEVLQGTWVSGADGALSDQGSASGGGDAEKEGPLKMSVSLDCAWPIRWASGPPS
jgi:hypothetical protein